MKHVRFRTDASRARMAGRRGFSVIDVSLTLAICTLLLSLLLPAVQAMREKARQVECANRLRQWSIAALQYEAAHRKFPQGGKRPFSGPFILLLPFVGESARYESIAEHWEPGDSDAQAWARQPFSLVRCPADDGKCNFEGNGGTGAQRYGYNGMFRYSARTTIIPAEGGPITVADVPDGLSNTAIFSEILPSRGRDRLNQSRLRGLWLTPRNLSHPDQFEEFCEVCRSVPPQPATYGWRLGDHREGNWTVSGSHKWYTHTLTPNLPSCVASTAAGSSYPINTAASLHTSGVNVAFADGHVQFVAETIDSQIWMDYGSRKASDLIQ